MVSLLCVLKAAVLPGALALDVVVAHSGRQRVAPGHPSTGCWRRQLPARDEVGTRLVRLCQPVRDRGNAHVLGGGGLRYGGHCSRPLQRRPGGRRGVVRSCPARLAAVLAAPAAAAAGAAAAPAPAFPVLSLPLSAAATAAAAALAAAHNDDAGNVPAAVAVALRGILLSRPGGCCPGHLPLPLQHGPLPDLGLPAPLVRRAAHAGERPAAPGASSAPTRRAAGGGGHPHDRVPVGSGAGAS
mmetsp:Transcript_62408/g.172925  ORF Transcript_62408/g.172925 Transcript_62408/m.172925 type:complete len:242 (+) Transcript_62408:112-837(+)